MSEFELVIIGGGLASASTIKAYRDAGGEGKIALVSADSTIPYHRPPLSKRYLREEAEREDTIVEPQSFYADNDVELLLSTTVVAVEPRERAVATVDDRRVRYRKLLIATGVQARQLQVAGADLEGVFTLRSLDDATAIRDAASAARDAVVVGGGFIGIEVAASLTELEIDVTLVSRHVDLFAQLGSPEVSEHLVQLYRGHGIDVVRGDEVRAFRGHSRLDTVELHSANPIGASLALVGIGVTPAVGFLNGSGMTVDGIVVNERFETNIPDIYAAGDVACFFDSLTGRRRRIEHWSNARYQGSQVGRILAGADGGYNRVANFFTESFGLTLKVFGDISHYDDRVTRGSFTDGNAIVFYFADGRLVASLHSSQGDETENQLMELVGARAMPATCSLWRTRQSRLRRRSPRGSSPGMTRILVAGRDRGPPAAAARISNGTGRADGKTLLSASEPPGRTPEAQTT
jgi:NADPH-dependent 2,4-dienoyl-CoA reductase/sulfur reductase-like enzyme